MIAVPVFCLVAMFGAWVWTRQSALTLNQKIDHTKAVIAEGDRLLISLVDAETAIRGYDLTQDADFLEPYDQALVHFSSALNQLQTLLSGESTRQQQLQQLQQLAQRRLNIINRRLELLQQASLANEAESNRLRYEGKTVMDAFRQELGELQREEQQLLNEYDVELKQIQRTTEAALWITISLSLLSCVVAIYFFNQLDRDLQERQQRLQESKILIQAIVENVVDGVITLNQQGKIEVFNPAAIKMFGYEPDEVLNQDLSILLADPRLNQPDPAELPQFFDQHQGKIGRPWQTIGYRKLGTTFPIEVSISAIQLGDRLLAIIRDITERQLAQEKLQAHADELARINAILAKTNSTLIERNQELDQFAYVASHDLKAPLRAIANLSEWLEEDLKERLPEDGKHLMHLLRGRVHRMEALLNGLLEYSRVGRTQLTPEEVDVTELLTEIIHSLNPSSNFILKIDPEMPTLFTNRIPLRQVFANLINNAIKHHDQPQGHIHISAQDLGNAYEFAVSDDGPGIDPKYHQKVFTIFQTLEARDTKESTGVGLSIVKKIVESQGGVIMLESEAGKGATFRFTWLK